MDEDEILNSQDPMQTITWCLRKANNDLMALAFKWPKTDDDKAKMVELKQKIKDLAVSVINYSFSSFPILSSVGSGLSSIIWLKHCYYSWKCKCWTATYNSKVIFCLGFIATPL